MSAIDARFISRNHMPPSKATAFVTKQIPVNATTISAGNTAHFTIGGSANAWCDPSASFFKFTVKNTHATASCQLPACGANALIENIQMMNAGSTLSNFQQFGTYYATKVAQLADTSFHKGGMSILHGSMPDLKYVQTSKRVASSLQGVGKVGAIILPGESATFCLPISHHSSLFGTGQMIWCGAANSLDLRYTFGGAGYGLRWFTLNTTPDANDSVVGTSAVVTGVESTHISIENMELVLNMVQLDDNVQSEVLAAMPDGLCYNARGVGYWSGSVMNGTGTHTANLGLGYSSLLELSAVFVDKSRFSTLKYFDNSTFYKNNLAKWNLTIDGSIVQDGRGINVGDDAELTAKQLIATGQLGDFKGLPISNGDDVKKALGHTPDDGSTSAILATELCVYKSNKSGTYPALGDLCAGVGTLASSSQINLEFGAGGSGVGDDSAKNKEFRVYSEYRQLIKFNPDLQIYEVSQ